MVSIVKTGSNSEPRPGSGEPFRTSDVCTIISLSIIKSGFKYSENIVFGALDKSKTSLKLFSCSGWKIMYLGRSPAFLTSDVFIRSNEMIRTKWPIY